MQLCVWRQLTGGGSPESPGGATSHAVLVWCSPGGTAQDPVEPCSFQAEGCSDDLHLFEAGTVSVMFLVEVIATLACDRRLTDDEITDLIESVVDQLDDQALEPSVGTARI